MVARVLVVVEDVLAVQVVHRQSPKIFRHAVQRLDHPVDLLGHRVEVEATRAWSRRRRAPPSRGCVQWWPARTQTPSRAEDLGHVVRVHALERERHDAAAVGRRRRAVDRMPGDLGQTLQRVRGELASRARGWRRGRSRSGSRSRRPGRRPRRSPACRPRTSRAGRSSVVPSSVTERIISPPVRNGRHLLEQLAARPEAPAPDGPHILWPEKREEVAAHAPARRPGRCGARLRAVDHDHAAEPCAAVGQLADRVDRAERVGLVDDREQLDVAGLRDLVQLVERQLAVLVDVHVAQRRAGRLRQHLPRDEVRVVLDLGDDDHVARADERAAVRVRDQVDRLGGVAGEDRPRARTAR